MVQTVLNTYRKFCKLSSFKTTEFMVQALFLKDHKILKLFNLKTTNSMVKLCHGE